MSLLMRRLRRLRDIMRLGRACARCIRRGQRDLLPQTIYVGFRQLGGVYVKFLQLLVLRSEAFQSLKAYDIYDVYDRVETEPIDIEAYLRKEFGEQAKQLALASSVPFAAGSFGQVYRATYQNRAVVLKVLRPSVRHDLRFDLSLLRLFSWCADLFATDNGVNIRELYKQFAHTTILETDYILEADYASKLYKQYYGHPNLVIPYTHRELSTAHVICQDYLDGIAMTDLMQLKSQGIDVEQYVQDTLGSNLTEQLIALGSEMLSGIFEAGITYGDPHPGNLKLLPDNRIGIIDYGLQAPAPRNTRQFYRLIEQYYKIYSGEPDIRGYSHVLLDMYGGDIIRAAHSLDAYYGMNTDKLLDELVDAAQGIINSQSAQTNYLLQNNKFMLLFSSVINKNNRFCLRYDVDGPEIARAGLLFISLVTGLGIKDEVLRQTYGNVLERAGRANISGDDSLLHPETAVEILAGWFDQISYKNPLLYRQIMQKEHHYA